MTGGRTQPTGENTTADRVCTQTELIVVHRPAADPAVALSDPAPTVKSRSAAAATAAAADATGAVAKMSPETARNCRWATA